MAKRVCKGNEEMRQGVTNNTIKVEIREDVLVRLLSRGAVCAVDFRCLDCRSRQSLRRLCLESCKDGDPP